MGKFKFVTLSHRFQNLYKLYKNIPTAISRLFWPPLCLLCGFRLEASSPSRTVCASCYEMLPILPPHCRQCAQFLPSTSQQLCGPCCAHPPAYDACYALFPYTAPIASLIVHLKFRQQLHYTHFFVEQFLATIKTAWYSRQALPDLILPMPLHPSRLKARGFNQAVEIARPLARQLGLPLDLTGIKRHKITIRQSSLSAKAREKNLAHAFIHTQSYANLHVAILDDVVTTGQTVVAVSEALRAAAAKRIDIWCCARR